MLDYIRNHQRLMFFVLLLFIAPPFVLWGVQGYSSFREGNGGVATVDGASISRQEYDEAQRDQIEAMRRRMGPSFDAKLLDTPKERQQVLDDLVTRRVLLTEVAHQRLAVSDAAVQKRLSEDPTIKTLYGPDGKFDEARYDQLLSMIGKTRTQVFNGVREGILLGDVEEPIAVSTIISKTVANQLDVLLTQKREIGDLVFKPADFTAQVKLAPDAVEKYYDANKKRYEIPEQVDIQYLTLDQATLAQAITISDADIKQYYDDPHNENLFSTPEERRVSHILIAVAKSASQEDHDRARARAQAILAQVRAHPADFAKLARENSQDPGSAVKGGDLDWAPSSNYVPEFKKAVDELKENQISDLVATQFGYHIIMVTGIRPQTRKPVDDVRADIVAKLRTARVRDQFAQSAEDFRNLVYQDADSLEPTAAKFGLKIQTASGVTRTPVAGNRSPLSNAKLLASLYSDDVLKNKHNTDAVELGPDSLIAARVTAYHAAQQRPLSEVAEGIRATLTAEDAARLAKAAGDAKLAALKTHDDAAGFSAGRFVSRTETQGVPAAAITEIFKADTSTLPAYASAAAADGSYTLYRITHVQQGAASSPGEVAQLEDQLGHIQGQLELDSLNAALKKKFKVTTSLPASDDADKAEQGSP